MSRTARALSALAVTGVALSALMPATAVAAARVSLSVSVADPDYATAVTVRGTGFQSIAKAHGGVYVLIGWVADGAWQPSRGGAAGATYRYIQDSEARDNRGYQRFVAFPGSDTASSANGGTVGADGSWSAEMIIPGARFRAVDRAGNTSEVDCTKVTCGIITIGAHGVVNPTNETFTPIRFAAPGAPPAATPPPAPAPGQAPPPQQGTPAAQPARAATLTAAAGVVEAGGTVAVTGTGFAADEQVTVTLGASKLFLAPAKSDAAGAVNHTATIPADVAAGAHTIEFTGASSGAVGSVPLTVTAAVAEKASEAPAPPSEGFDWRWAAGIGAGAVLIVGAILLLRKRKKVHS
ncbi:hypothetical protein [Lentzea cavernae]|uniref:IPT/TIG domain-containing protein n=1 Tax=Lentzea cavernae TaxID=2020703 RepID=A0ABQ3MF66_9PSEU|nr:hypothetical protein [Lentzea cavernae]GHH39149.1 hypothetical protein GCM10017774_30300 [Lentzea cavernae]